MELGFGEIVVIAAIVLLLFGPKKLPQLGEALGRGIRNFKDGMSGKDDAPGEPPAQQALPPASQASEQTTPASQQTIPAQPSPGASSVNGVPARDAPR